MTIKQLTTLLLSLVTLAINGLANALPINGQTTGEISDRFDVLFVPAGYVFSIWGVIYIGLIAYAVYQALPAQRDNQTLNEIAPLYWLASVANSAWILLWHYEYFAWTVPVMLTLLVSLILIYRRVAASPAQSEPGFRRAVGWTFSIYLGWISVATIANIAQYLFYIDWSAWGLSPVTWTLIMLAVASGLGLAMLFREADYLYALVLVWAFIGIASKQNAAGQTMVGAGAYLAAGVLFVGMALLMLRRRSFLTA